VGREGLWTESAPDALIGHNPGGDIGATVLRIAGDASKLVIDTRSRRCLHPKERVRRMQERGDPREPEDGGAVIIKIVKYGDYDAAAAEHGG
jgi:hypothetical protein